MATTKKPQVNKGLEQAQEIYKIFNTMDLKQKEAFLLGRISVVLEIGNNISEGLNDVIKESDSTLVAIRKELYSVKENKDAVSKSVSGGKRTATKRTTKKS